MQFRFRQFARITVSLADEIRLFAYNHLIAPVLDCGTSDVVIRAGDIHAEMGLDSRMPSVCAALSAKAMEAAYGLKRIDRRGPNAGANVFFRFALDPRPEITKISARISASSTQQSLVPINPSAEAVYLVSCVKTKRATAAPAGELYISDWFKSARAFVESRGSRWFILSAKYGLVDPGSIVEPYEKTLKQQPIGVRRQWAAQVTGQLLMDVPNLTTIVMLAGQTYAEFLIPRLRAAGIEVVQPMAGLSFGNQLGWLKRMV